MRLCYKMACSKWQWQTSHALLTTCVTCETRYGAATSFVAATTCWLALKIRSFCQITKNKLKSSLRTKVRCVCQVSILFQRTCTRSTMQLRTIAISWVWFESLKSNGTEQWRSSAMRSPAPQIALWPCNCAVTKSRIELLTTTTLVIWSGQKNLLTFSFLTSLTITTDWGRTKLSILQFRTEELSQPTSSIVFTVRSVHLKV